MFNWCEHPRGVRVGLKILYRNPRRPGEAGIKLVPDQSQKAAEREILERLGFTVIEMTPAPFTLISSDKRQPTVNAHGKLYLGRCP
jgi:hypothetical protein